jgi:hypothetical protein
VGPTLVAGLGALALGVLLVLGSGVLDRRRRRVG